MALGGVVGVVIGFAIRESCRRGCLGRAEKGAVRVGSEAGALARGMGAASS